MNVRMSFVGTWEVFGSPRNRAGVARERRKPNLMMHGSKKSDPLIVVMKPTNNGTAVPAEPVERRGGTEGNSRNRNTCRTLSRESVSHGAARVRQAAKRNRKEPLTALLHHITVEALEVAYFGLKANAATGVDGVSWLEYGEELEARLRDLHTRIHKGAYRAPPVRRVNIPKPDGGTRPLGVAALEDKIVQKAVVDCILSPIYETMFLGFSYGFRPKRGAHDALDALGYAVSRKKVNWIVDADIKAFFDRIDRDQLIRFVEHRIGDRRVVRLIRKWLDAGVMENGHWKDEGMGTPQGAVVSPVLANVYLHYALDLWFDRKWRKHVATGEAIIVRYADDFVVGFERKGDARRFLKDLGERLGKFKLELHPTKTRLLEFGRFAASNRAKRGDRKPETFDFLGFTHFCAKTRKGWSRLGRKPISKRRTAFLKRLSQKLRRRCNVDMVENGKWLGRSLGGWLQYYAVPGTPKYISNFKHCLKRIWMKSLRRRSQKDRFPWERLERMIRHLWPHIHIRHPWPEQRFADKHLR